MTTIHPAGGAATILVCLPAGSATHGPDRLLRLLTERLAAVGATGRAALCPHHLPVPDPLPGPMLRLTYAPRPYRPQVQTAAAAPLALLDLHRHRRAVAVAAAGVHAAWRRTVAGTGTARPWRHFLDTQPPEQDPRQRLQRAWEAFAAQPRIAAMLAAERGGHARFTADQYGPGLCAHQDGPARFADYVADTIQFGDAVLDPRGRLVGASDPLRPRVEHTPAERHAYHAAALHLLGQLDLDTVLAAVHIDL